MERFDKLSNKLLKNQNILDCKYFIKNKLPNFVKIIYALKIETWSKPSYSKLLQKLLK
jgi:hypothetical protein